MKISLPWAIAGVVCIVAGYVVYDRSADSRRAADASAAATAPVRSVESASLTKDVEALQREVARLQLNIAAANTSKLQDPKAVEDSSPVTSAEQLAALAVERRAAREQDELRLQAHLNAVGARFDREGRDERWARETSMTLEATFAAEAMRGVTYRNIDCRTTTCRVEIPDDGSPAVQRTVARLALASASVLSSMRVDRIEQNGSTTLVLYMSR